MLAVEWLKGETRSVHAKLCALVAFFEKYLVQQGLPIDPAVFLARSTVLPNFFQTVCPASATGVKYNNYIHAFLNFVLLWKFSIPADDGRPVVSPVYHNPVAPRSKVGLPQLDESVRSSLPYGYIDELRQMLAEGPHFVDWQWAQSAIGREIGTHGALAPDWFTVTELNIDRDDPDCVWRIRQRHHKRGPILEMWSPVRWVALLTKLILPVRSHGEILNDRGRTLFEVGFAKAIRKVLGE